MNKLTSQSRITRLALLTAAAALPSIASAAQIDVIATQTISHPTLGANVDAITTDTTWTKDNVYILTDKVFVTDGATLTIEAGTKIYSTLDDKGTGTPDDDEFGALVITRGSKIEAQGTASEPIIFTTTDELEAETQTDIDGDTFVAECPSELTYARWGGVVILGDALIARDGVRDGTKENRIEGFQPAASADLDSDGRADVIEYGGNNDADDSGTFSYVVIRHGGYVYSGGNEINGLTLGAVGSGTQIDHVEVFANADDGIEFFGGSVNTSYMAMVLNQDDSFDIDEGFMGTNQFWFCVQAPFADDFVSSGHDNGGEWDGITGTQVSTEGVVSGAAIYNATFVGSGTTALAGNDKGNNAIFIDDRFGGKIYDSVFDDFSRDLVGSASDGPGDGLTFGHNTVGRFGGGTPGTNLTYVSDAGAANTFFDGSGNPINGNSNANTDPEYTAYSRNLDNELEVLDPRPAATSPLWTSNGATLQGTAPVTVAHRGAFGADNWAAGWTTADARGLFIPKVDVIAEQTVSHPTLGANVNAITTDTTWTKDNLYILTDKVFVTDGATLTIEAGTKIYSTLNDQGTGTPDDDEFGALVITRGSNIEAQGTASEPIVFTTSDELEAETCTDIDGDGFIAEAPSELTYARWGGVVVLGDALIARDGVRDGTKENRIEGFQPAASADLDSDGRADVIEYGGNNDADDSGTISYVVIRHGGYVYSGGNEINGLTLGAVGSGTQIDHVEVFANADDGIEFFGGAVNTSYMAMILNQDDSFDIDEGYMGTNQFWFAIQSPFADDLVSSGHDNGGEWDGITGTQVSTEGVVSGAVIYNATFIGSGTTALAGNDKGNNAIFIDDRFGGKVYNSVFDDFSRDLVGSASDGPGNGLSFACNTVGRFGGGAYTGSNASNLTFVSDSGAANTFFDAAGSPINGNSNGGTDPQYEAYSRDFDNFLIEIDPRPSATSPLWTANLQPGAPVATTFRGAFGSSNWAAGWTTASAKGFVTGEAASGGSGNDTDGDGVDDTLEQTAELQALGFSVGVNDSALFASIYTESSILDLVTGSQVMIQGGGNGGNTTLSLPLFRSNDLSTFTPAPALEATFTGSGEAEFYRIEVPAP